MRSLVLSAFLGVLAIGLNAQSPTLYCGSSNTNGVLVDFAAYGDSVYATGFFTNACGDPANYIAVVNGTDLDPCPVVLNDAGHSLRVIDDHLFIAAYRDAVDSNYLWRFDGSSTTAFGHGVFLTTASGFSNVPNIYDAIEYQDEIYICGEFDRAGGQPVEGIARWDGNRWQPLEQGLQGSIPGAAPVRFPHTLFVHDGLLYAGGNFRTAGSQTVNGIAVWDGSTWSPMGDGFNNTVYSLAFFNGQLYAGGAFTASGSADVDRIARWNGTGWESPGFGFSESGPSDFIFVHTMEVEGDDLYMLGGLKQLDLDDGTSLPCGGIVGMDNDGNLETFGSGVIGNDLEAFFARSASEFLLGGGVFGGGWFGGLTLISGMEDQSQNAQAILVHPNPFQEYLQWNGPSGEGHLSLHRLDGVRMFQWQGHLHASARWETKDLAPGHYVLHWQQDGHQGYQRLQKGL